MVMLSKRTGDSKSNLREASMLLGPMTDIQAVPLLPSLMLEMEWVELGLQAKQSCEFEMQNWSSAEHTESVCTVLPVARFPMRGKHPAVLLH